MIKIESRIYAWVMQMSNARTMWSQEKIEVENDRYIEYIEYTYNGINAYL